MTEFCYDSTLTGHAVRFNEYCELHTELFSNEFVIETKGPLNTLSSPINQVLINSWVCTEEERIVYNILRILGEIYADISLQFARFCFC